jgi:hypothetical protein
VWPKGEDLLHYEFIPGVTREENLSDNLWVTSSDNISTPYNENHSGGTSSSGGVSSSGDEDLGGRMPPEAEKLWLEFSPHYPPRAHTMGRAHRD